MTRETVTLCEVGLRDGLQNQPSLIATADKLALAEALVDAGLGTLEAVSFVHPKAVPQMADAAEVTQGLPHFTRLDYLALTPNMKGYERARDSGYRHVAVVVATTDTFNQRNLRMSLAETLATCETVIRQARQDGLRVRAYVSGALSCPYEGETPVAVVHELSERLIAAGASTISIADTIGAGYPAQLKRILQPLISTHGAALFNVHLHDTRGMAVTNAYAALECGVRSFDGSIGGLGGCPFAPGATGNVATENLAYLLEREGLHTGLDMDRLQQAVAVAERITGLALGGAVTTWQRSQQARTASKQTANECAPGDGR